jgi:hypothetical protein
MKIPGQISWEDSSPQLIMSCIKRISSATWMDDSMAAGKPFAKRYKHRKTSGNGLHMRMYAVYKKQGIVEKG